jgi:hypothetical protein
LFYPFGVVVVSGGWQHEGAFPFGMEYSVTMDGGTIEYNSAGRPPTLYTQTEQALPLGCDGQAVRDGYAAEIEYFVECCCLGRQPERCPPRDSALAVELMHALLVARERDGRKILCSNLG